MRAVVMREFGPPEVLEPAEVAEVQAGPDEVVIEVEFANVTFVETQVRAGRPPHPSMLPTLPAILGNGVGGTVGDDSPWSGARVVASLNGTGGYAERAIATASALIRIPDELATQDAVALLADGRTALALAGRVDLRAGDTVLVEAAGGGWARCWCRSPGGPDPGHRAGRPAAQARPGPGPRRGRDRRLQPRRLGETGPRSGRRGGRGVRRRGRGRRAGGVRPASRGWPVLPVRHGQRQLRPGHPGPRPGPPGHRVGRRGGARSIWQRWPGWRWPRRWRGGCGRSSARSSSLPTRPGRTRPSRPGRRSAGRC